MCLTKRDGFCSANIVFILNCHVSTYLLQYVVIIRPLDHWARKMNQTLHCDWLLERARWLHLARSGLPALSNKKTFPENHIINPLLATLVRSRWLAFDLVVSSRVYGPRLYLGSKTSNENRAMQYAAFLTEQAWSVTQFSNGYFIRGSWVRILAEAEVTGIFLCLLYSPDLYFFSRAKLKFSWNFLHYFSTLKSPWSSFPISNILIIMLLRF